MKKSSILPILFSIVLSTLTFHSVASLEDDDIWLLEDIEKFRVLINVASDVSQDEVTGYLRDELESFDDVIVVEEEPHFVILFNVEALMYSDGRFADVVSFSVLILEPLNLPLMLLRLKADGPMSSESQYHQCDANLLDGDDVGFTIAL